MKICPNLSDPTVKAQWDAITNHPELSSMEAMREFMESERDNRPVATPEQVIEKLARREQPRSELAQQAEMDAQESAIQAKSNDPVLGTDPNSLFGNAILMNPINTKTLSVEDNSTTRGMEIATKLSQQLNIDFQTVSPEEAMSITAGAQNPYSGAAAFFYQGTVYFVGNNLNTELAFHEFSHPLVRTIQQQNPALFQKLVNQAIAADPTLLEAAKAEYSNLRDSFENETDPVRAGELADKYQNIVGEEILVKALTKAALAKDQNQQLQGPFAKFINDLLYAMKQLLRKAFGKKADVKNLSADTTMDQLAEMLVKGGQIEIDTNAVSDKDVVAYHEEFNEYLEDLKKATDTVGGQNLTDLARKMYEGASQQIDMLMKNRNYREMLELFVDEYNRGDLQEMRSNVAKYAKNLEAKMKATAADIDAVRNETQAVVGSMLRLEVMMKKMEKHLGELEKNVNDRDNVHKAYYYSHVLNYWQKYIAEAQDMMRKSKNDSRSPMNQLLNSISNTMKNSAESINRMNSTGVAEVLWDQWKDMAESAEKLFNEQIETLKKKGANQSVIEKAYIEFYGLPMSALPELKALRDKQASGEGLTYDELERLEKLNKLSLDGMTVTKAKIEAALRGEGKDANWANSYLEGYLYNTDPVVGGFARFFKDNMTEMEARAQSRINDIVSELKPALDEAGISFSKIGDLGKQIGFVDKIGYYDQEKKEFVTKEVWTLLNPYKDYRFTIDKFNYDIKQLQDAYNRSGSDVDKKNLADKIAEKNKHLREFFNQKYVDEFYEANEMLENDTTGRAAAYERNKITEQMSALSSKALNEFDVLNSTDQMNQLWKQYRLLHSLYNEDGTKKTNSYVDDAGNIIYSSTFIEPGLGKNNIVNDLAIAERLIAYKEATKKFYEYKERPGVFENALLNFENEIDQNIKKYLGPKPDGSDPKAVQDYNDDYEAMFETYRSKWITLNTRTVIKPEFYAKRSKILARIKELTARPLERVKAEIAKATDPVEKARLQKALDRMETKLKKVDFSDSWTTILDTVSGYRDDDGQPIGTDLPDGRREKIKDAQQAMEDSKAEWAGMSGLTREEMDRLIGYSAKRALGLKLSAVEFQDFRELLNQQNVSGLTEFESAELNGRFAELRELQRKEPTEYYTDIVNQHLNRINSKEAYDLLKATELDATNMEKLYDPKVLDILMQDSKFKEWFDKNHISKEVYDKEEEENVTKYERLYVWNVVKPNDESMYETTDITREDGTIEHIKGVPKLKYYSRTVKKEYRTGYDPATGEVRPVVGVHKDNSGREDGWLPKQKAGSPYINEEYFRLKNADPESKEGKLFKVLEIISRNHLKNQEGLSKRGKLYLDFPRFEMEGLETLQAKGVKGAKEKVSAMGAIFKKIANFFKGAKADSGVNFNWEQENQLVRADAFNDQIENIPIQGLFNLELKEVSTDIVSSMFRYLYAAENHKQLVKMHPIASGIKSILDDQHLKEPDKINRSNFLNRGMVTYLNKKGRYIRQDAFSNLYNREFLGQKTTGAGKDWKGLQNLQRFLFGRASFSFFAFNIPSAMKNAMGAKFQALIHSSAGTDLTPATLMRGEVWSSKYMMKLSFGDAYTKGQKSLEHQIGEIFDPVQGRFEEKFGKSISRTLLSDAASTGWFTNFRKWTEIQASMQTFGGMMYKQQVEMNGKMIDYMDAWELGSNGKIQLKAGIDPKWGITYDAEGNQIVGEEFKKFRSRVHAVMNKLNGAYAKFDQPEMQRYLAFRFVSFLRRFFTTMAVNRFGTKRWNPGYGEIDEGYYLTAVKSFLTLIKTRNVNNMTQQDKRAWMKFVTEVGTLYLMSMLVGLLWGWDDDDEERFEKLRKRSSFLPGPLTRDYQPGEEFDFGGFMSLHAMNLMMQVRAENEQFMPFPGMGLSNVTTVVDLKSLAFGPTTDTYQQLGTDMYDIIDGNDRQFYKRRVGAYEWQDQGGRKVWAHIAKMFGLNASNIDPAQSITNFQKAKNLASKK